ncbi:ABC transporter ATP-binding protein/permease [Haloferax sp. KTX1]|uniref:ABC transporter ATP-binding protein/permease n=1 Tax=Haloferax sp. KTX1 TaxID=2600597 RepID=UPI0011DD913F|nr:ABC transporter ATP-binding protein/permease [Haloferax sp. KTX1]
MSSPEPSADAAASDAATPANRPPFLAVVAPRISEAAALATTLLPGVSLVVRAPRSASPSNLRATLAAMRRAGAPLVVATDSAAAVRDADRVHVADGGVVVESGPPDDLLAVPGVYARRYGTELGANFAGPGKDVDDE